MNLKRTTKVKKRLFTGIEIILVLALVFGGVSGTSNYKQKRELKKMSQENTKQAVVIDNLVQEVKTVNDQKDDTVERLQKVEETLKEKAATGFSILYEQAVDINKEQSSTYSKAHEKTAKDYVKVWGYDAMAKLIKWQHDQIEKQLKETKELMKEKDKLKTEYMDYKLQTQELIHETKTKSEEHRMSAKDLEGKVSAYLDKNSWLGNVIFWLAIGTGGYFFITLGGVPLFFSFKNKAISQIKEQLEMEKKKKSKALKGIKSFKAANTEGNETMDKILEAMGVDVDGDDDD